MSANDALLFIDANKYLDLYRTINGTKLLAPLGEQVDYIFVTQQVVNEVQRNKLQVASDFLIQQFLELKLRTFGLPDHLSGISNDKPRGIRQKMGEIVDEIKKVNEDVDALAMDIMEQISYSEDEVSRALTSVFTKAVPYSSEELQRARNRRELGNPPGKTNSIGDQLTWEQILTRFEGKKRLWIISRDGDFGTFHKDKGLLNRFLFDELCKLTPAPEVFLFEDTATGIKHFIETTGVKADKRLTPEETKEIKEEEKSLPHWDQTYALDRLSAIPPEHTSAIKHLAKAFANATHPLGQMPKVPPEHTSAIKHMAEALANATHPLEQMPKVPPVTHQSPEPENGTSLIREIKRAKTK